jgi:imidazolonepropionase-like amidohydrolase
MDNARGVADNRRTVKRYALAILLLLPSLLSAQPIAIRDVTIVDAQGGPPQPGMTVLIDGERIAAVGRMNEIGIPEKAQAVNATGKFLVPGLWDMHVHGYDVRFLPLYLANGVTGVRVMAGEPPFLKQRREIAEGTLSGPRMMLAGAIVDGPKPFWPGSIAVATAAQGRDAVRRTQEEGYDFVKVYTTLPREAFLAIADEAKKRGIPFAGHVPNAVRAAEASDAGMKSIEHLLGMLLAVSSAEEEVRAEFAAAARMAPGGERAARFRRASAQALETYDQGRAAALFARLKANGTWQVPTFTLLHAEATLGEPALAADPRLRFMPAWVRNLWSSDQRLKSITPESQAQAKRFFDKRLALVGEMHRAGVGILAGSDVLNPYCFPGFSLHDELEWLVKAGLSPLAALQVATRNPAVFLERTKDFGAVEKGKIADLVLLDADPVQDIRNTRRISAVIANGKMFARKDLDRMLADAERMAAAN